MVTQVYNFKSFELNFIVVEKASDYTWIVKKKVSKNIAPLISKQEHWRNDLIADVFS